MEMANKEVGSGGEQAAAQYLVENGYEILAQNFRISGSEVDLIAKKDDILCFIEVKTRGTDRYGLPEEFVNARKRSKIIRAAKIYTGSKAYADCYVRFDIISVLNLHPRVEINHITHAFQEN